MLTDLSGSEPTYSVRFTTSYRDLYRALRAINRAVPMVQRIRRVAFALLALGIAALVAAMFTPWSRALVTLAMLLIFVPLIVLPIQLVLPAYMAWLTRRQSALWQGEQELEFTDEGIRSRGTALAGFTRWEAIMRVAESRDFILFFSSDQCGYFVPKAALPDEHSARELAAFIRDHAGRPSRGDAATSEPRSEFTSAPTVRVTFEPDAAEMSRAAMAVAYRTGQLWPVYGFVLLLVSCTTGPTIYRQWSEGGWASVSISGLLLGLMPLFIVLAAGPLAARFAARRQIRTGPSTSGPQTISVHDEGIVAGGALYNGDFRWASLQRVEETNEFFLFLLSKAQGVYLPKRTLPEGDVTLVRQLVRAKEQELSPIARRKA